MDVIAREIGEAPEDLRRRNFIRPDQMPYRTQTGRTYDTGDFAGHLSRALDLADRAGFEARAEEARRRGLLRGLGFSCYIEACAGGSAEGAQVRLDADGGATVLIGTQTNGQGHHTAYGQLVSEHLDLPPDRVRVLQGDTDVIAKGGGTGGSRSVPVGGASVAGAARRLGESLKGLAARSLGVDPAEVEIAEGAVRVPGTNYVITFAEIAALPEATQGTLSAEEAWRPPEATYPNGTHVCEVEIDPETGVVEVVGYTIVDDFGVVLNPLLLEGQVHGGAAQGIGQALHERTLYDARGQLLTASLSAYRLPRAADLPNFRFETRNVPSATNVLGLKGAGEAGAIGACPAVINAVVDALHRAHGIRHIDMPATADKVFLAIAEAEQARSALETA